MTTIAVINQKGGVGKTTTAINLAAGLARAEYPTLLIDLDPQGNASLGVGLDLEQLGPKTIAEALLGDVLLGSVIRETYLPSLQITPATLTLANAEIQLFARHFREQHLARALQGLTGLAYVVIDCPPNLGLLPVNAMVAADRFLVPTESSALALHGLGDLLGTLHKLRDDTRWDYRVLRTKVDGRATVTNATVLREMEPVAKHLLETVIHRNEALNRAFLATTPCDIHAYDASARGAKDYQALTQEILKVWPA